MPAFLHYQKKIQTPLHIPELYTILQIPSYISEVNSAAAVYGADRSWYLVNGSTCGILAAIAAAVKPGEKILMARNSHKSAYHAVILNQLEPVYLYPEEVPEFGVYRPALEPAPGNVRTVKGADHEHLLENPIYSRLYDSYNEAVQQANLVRGEMRTRCCRRAAWLPIPETVPCISR